MPSIFVLILIVLPALCLCLRLFIRRSAPRRSKPSPRQNTAETPLSHTVESDIHMIQQKFMDYARENQEPRIGA